MNSIMNEELCNLKCKEILSLSSQILAFLNEDLVEEALATDAQCLHLIKDFTASLGEYRSCTLSDFCVRYIELHGEIMKKISDMQCIVTKCLENKHNSAKKICAYENISRSCK